MADIMTDVAATGKAEFLTCLGFGYLTENDRKVHSVPSLRDSWITHFQVALFVLSGFGSAIILVPRSLIDETAIPMLADDGSEICP